MQLTDNFVLKFQMIYEAEFHEKLSYEKAYAECMDMFVLGKILFRPVSKQDIHALELSKES